MTEFDITAIDQWGFWLAVAAVAASYVLFVNGYRKLGLYSLAIVGVYLGLWVAS